jgi:hypothetical protein
MTITDVEFTGRKKEECEDSIKSLFPNDWSKGVLIFQAVWHGIVEQKWPFRCTREGAPGIQIKVYAFAKFAGVPQKDVHKWFMRLEKVNLLQIEYEPYSEFYKIFLTEEILHSTTKIVHKKKIVLDNLAACVFNKSEAKAKDNLFLLSKKDNSFIHDRPLLTSEIIGKITNLGFSRATVITCWKHAKTAEDFWNGLEMAIERVEKGTDPGRYAFWAVTHPVHVKEYFIYERKEKFRRNIEANLAFLKNYCYSGTTCVSVDLATAEVVVKLLDREVRISLLNAEFRKGFEPLSKFIQATDAHNRGKIECYKIDSTVDQVLLPERMSPLPLEGNPLT